VVVKLLRQRSFVNKWDSSGFDTGLKAQYDAMYSSLTLRRD
jgi:hypothetical protein